MLLVGTIRFDWDMAEGLFCFDLFFCTEQLELQNYQIERSLRTHSLHCKTVVLASFCIFWPRSSLELMKAPCPQ